MPSFLAADFVKDFAEEEEITC